MTDQADRIRTNWGPEQIAKALYEEQGVDWRPRINGRLTEVSADWQLPENVSVLAPRIAVEDPELLASMARHPSGRSALTAAVTENGGPKATVHTLK